MSVAVNYFTVAVATKDPLPDSRIEEIKQGLITAANVIVTNDEDIVCKKVELPQQHHLHNGYDGRCAWCREQAEDGIDPDDYDYEI